MASDVISSDRVEGTEGFEAAIERAQKSAEPGADILFVEAVTRPEVNGSPARKLDEGPETVDLRLAKLARLRRRLAAGTRSLRHVATGHAEWLLAPASAVCLLEDADLSGSVARDRPASPLLPPPARITPITRCPQKRTALKSPGMPSPQAHAL